MPEFGAGRRVDLICSKRFARRERTGFHRSHAPRVEQQWERYGAPYLRRGANPPKVVLTKAQKAKPNGRTPARVRRDPGPDLRGRDPGPDLGTTRKWPPLKGQRYVGPWPPRGSAAAAMAADVFITLQELGDNCDPTGERLRQTCRK